MLPHSVEMLETDSRPGHDADGAVGKLTASDGCKIAYEVKGEGPPLLLIPGLGGSGSFWSPVIQVLRKRFMTVTFDHRGAGRSDRPRGKYEAARIAADASELLVHAGLERTVVIGHSTGGLIAQYLALDHSNLVSGLVLSGTWAKPDERFRTLFAARRDVLLQAGAATYQSLTHALGYTSEYLSQNSDALRRAVWEAESSLQPVDVATARIDMLLSDERSSDLPGIHARTLVVGATDDAMIPFHHSKQLASLIPHSSLLEMNGGHFFPKAHPKPFADACARFAGGNDE